MSFKTAKNAVLILAFTVLAAGNVYSRTYVPKGLSEEIVFYDKTPEVHQSNEKDDVRPENTATGQDADVSGLVNINTAGLDELQSLPGIGPVKAKAILDYRERYGSFVAKEEITEVKGIGNATYDKIKKLITVK